MKTEILKTEQAISFIKQTFEKSLCKKMSLSKISSPLMVMDGRSAFVAAPEHIFVSADYSQVELRVMAHFCEDPGMLSAFKRNIDIHSAVAVEVFDVRPEDVTSKMRSMAKAVNFGLIYGQGVYGLSNLLGIPRKEAKTFIDRYFERFPLVQQFKIDEVERTKSRGYIETICGRRRYIPQLTSSGAAERAQGERLVINTLIQGSAADLIKIAMLKIDSRIRRENLPMELLLQIHDELLYELPIGHEEIAAKVIKEEMEKALELKVPLKVTVGVGSNWLELK